MERITREQAQQAIMQKFVEAYYRQHGIQLVGIVERDKPDFEAMISESRQKIGIEVTGIYQDEREAKINYSEITEWDSHPSFIEKVIPALNTGLENKAKRSRKYEYDGRIILVIWVGSFIYNTPQDFSAIGSKIKVPDSRFSEIWLVLRDDNTDQPMLLSLSTHEAV
jgi:hypothetical protein